MKTISIFLLCSLFPLQDLSAQDGSILYKFDGQNAGDALGAHVASAGDVDGDGVPDYMFNAPSVNLGFIQHVGEVTVISGATGDTIYEYTGTTSFQGLGLSIDGLGDVTGDSVDDFVIGYFGANAQVSVYSGATGLEYRTFGGHVGGIGQSASYVGDVDGDGLNDLLVGEPLANLPGGAGAEGAFAIYSVAFGARQYTIYGATQNQNLGTYVGSAGDFNGDGIPDVWASSSPTSLPGFVEIYSGIDGAFLHKFNGPPVGIFGQDAAGIGDLNGDGFDEMIISSPSYPSYQEGTVWVYSGNTGSVMYEYTGQVGDFVGGAVGSAGDFNGDGTPDFAYACGKSSTEGGKAVVKIMSGATGLLLFEAKGAGAFGSDFASVLDLNGDGKSELLVGGPRLDPNGKVDSGSAFVVSPTPALPPTLTVTGTCPSITQLSVTGATPGGNLGFAYGLAGSFVFPGGDCEGVVLGIQNPNLGIVMTATNEGDLVIDSPPLASICGMTLQVLDFWSCHVSNAVVL